MIAMSPQKQSGVGTGGATPSKVFRNTLLFFVVFTIMIMFNMTIYVSYLADSLILDQILLFHSLPVPVSTYLDIWAS